METCISTMLTPAKHFLHAENKQPLTFVPDRWVQHDCWSDLRLSSGTQKNKWPASENGKVRWKSYGNSRGRRIPFSSYLRQDNASSSLCHHLPHPPIVIFWLLQLRGQRAAATSWYPPGSAPELEEQRRVTSPQMASRSTGPMQHGTRQLLSTSLCKLAEERE